MSLGACNYNLCTSSKVVLSITMGTCKVQSHEHKHDQRLSCMGRTEGQCILVVSHAECLGTATSMLQQSTKNNMTCNLLISPSDLPQLVNITHLLRRALVACRHGEAAIDQV